MTTHMVCVGRPWGHAVYEALLDSHSTHPLRSWAKVTEGLDLLRALVFWRPRYVFCLNWSAYLPPYFTNEYECVNFHCTALPYGRGGGPIENLILRGHTETVLTAHRMTAEVDAGPIYTQRHGISLAGPKARILDRFVEPCTDMIDFISRTEPVPTPQAGTPVVFTRLPHDEYDALWAARC